MGDSWLINLWWLLGTCALFFTLCLLVTLGALRLLNPPTLTITPRASLLWERQLSRWGALAPYATEVERQAMAHQYRLLVSFGLVGGGIAGILASLASIAMVLVYHGTIDALPESDRLLTFLSLIMAIVALFGLGSIVGFIMEHRQAREKAHTYAEGERRTLHDFCASWVWLVPLCVMATVIAIDIGIAVSSPPHSNPMPDLLPSALAAALTCVAAALTVVRAWLIIRSPIFRVSVDPRINQLADDRFYANYAVNQLQSFWIFSALILVGASSSWDSAPSLQSVGWISPVATLCLFAAMGVVLGSMALLIAVASGQLGGRLTGWWWQQRPAPHEQDAAEGA